MPKAKDRIDELIEKADEQAALVATGEIDPLSPIPHPSGFAQPDDVVPGMMRIHIVSTDHTDGKAKKTWLRDSVIEIDQYTAMRMINNLRCAYPTTEPINEILVPYKGK